ncbi:MAG: LL-diaminopimelate aminotransferase [bacterium]|nr:LL-diaminopimelate aminotransferase [bacterium]
MIKIDYSRKIKQLPPYLFAEMDRLKQEGVKQGQRIISFGIGDPDLATPEPIIQALKKAADAPENHHYPSYEGLFLFRKEISQWFIKRYGVSLDPETEILSLLGSKEGIGHLPFAFIDKNDFVLVPDPGYTVYRSGTVFAGGTPYLMPLRKENGFLPDLKAIPERIKKRARLMFINYPNNPTAASAPRAFFEDVVKMAQRYHIIVAHDAAYNEMYFDNEKPFSFLEVKGARDVGIEFHSFSKTFNMTGWRVGFAAGNADILKGLGSIKNNLDSGVFQAVQYAAMEALRRYDELSAPIRKVYGSRRDLVAARMDELGWKYVKPKATFYFWVETPAGYDSRKMTMRLLQEAGIMVTPGNGFGENGEGFIRLAVTVNDDLINEAFDKIGSIRW